MRIRKRLLSLALAGVLVFQVNGVDVLAGKPQEKDVAQRVEIEEIKIGSTQMETPVIPDAAKALKGVGQPEISLNEATGDGTWEYLFDIPDYKEVGGIPAPDAANQDFDFSKWEDRDWQAIKVPGEPLMQGFDILTNNEYYYRRSITIPKDYAGKRILVRFDGVYCNSRVWINGTHIRTHIGGFTTWDCDITEYAVPGETVEMVVGVADIYADTKGIWNPEGKSLNNPSNATKYAHHNIGGINRDVSLLALDYDYIARTYIETDLDDTFTDASLAVTVQLGMVSEEAMLGLELLDGDQTVAFAQAEFTKADGQSGKLQKLVEEADTLLKENQDNVYEGENGTAGQYSKDAWEELAKERDYANSVLRDLAELSVAKKITVPVEHPQKWDAEHPNLYTLRTTLYLGDQAVQVNEEKVGFREIHYGGREGTDANKVYVNGREVKLRGTCRHDVSDDLGRSMTRDEAYREARAYKNANINHIRTSHYPASEHLLDACDELGIYVEQETAVCFQGYDTEYGKYEDYLPQFAEMIERDRNRPSILIWSLGNESNYSNVANQSGGNAFQKERDYLRDVDTSRPCIFSWPNTGEPDGFADIFSAHYYSVSGGLGNSSRPVLHDEFAHISCYNLDELQRDVNVRNFWGEGIKIGWENIFMTDGALGCDLWGGIDDVFYIPEGTHERWQSHSDGQTAGYGEWGSVLDAYLREKPEAYLTKKAYSPVRVEEKECYLQDGTLYLPLKNWFDHTDMNELKLVYTAGEMKKEIQIAQSIAPHAQGVVLAPDVPQDTDTVNLKFYTPDGIMVDEYNVQLASVAYRFTPASEKAPAITNSADEIRITGEGFEVIFDKETGLISEASYQDVALVTGGPYLHVTGMNLGAWIPDTQNSLAVEPDGNYVVVTLKGSYENGQKATFRIKISGNGIMETEYTLTSAPATAGGLREVGVSYDIPNNVQSVSWMREGLYSAYPEDHIGRNTGTALKVREGSDQDPDVYGKEPAWPWKDDMKNYFVYSTDDPNNGTMTNDFKTMREHIRYYNVNYGADENAPHISVESKDADVAARVESIYDLGYVDDRDASVKYTGNWSSFGSSSDYAGTEMYSAAVGDTCEFTFQGTGIRFIGSKQNNTGNVKVYIDGEFQEEIDTYSDLGNHLKQTVIYSNEKLTDGEHTIKLETSGGRHNCIVVDAFEVLQAGGGSKKEKSKLVINQQWYYPNLSWGNYGGNEGRLTDGSKGSAVIRLCTGNHMIREKLAGLSRVRVTVDENATARVSYNLQGTGENTEVKLQWYRVAVGDPDSKAQMLQGETKETLDVSALNANKVYCEATLVKDGIRGEPQQSNAVTVGEDKYRYVDITVDSGLFTFEGTNGRDYQTDENKAWTANAYNRTVTYLMDTPDPASMTYIFNGSGIRWIGSREKNQGIAEIILDGETTAEVDLFDAAVGSGQQISEILFEKNWDVQGEHTIQIVRTGKKHADSSGTNVSLDAFIVISGNEVQSNVYEVSDEIRYAAQKETAVNSVQSGNAEINQAIGRLTAAIQAFMDSRIPECGSREIVRKMLQAVCNAYTGLDEDDFTEESMAKLNQALKDAREILKNQGSSEDTMIQAAGMVMAAAAQLKVDFEKADQELLKALEQAKEVAEQAQENAKQTQEDARKEQENVQKIQEAVQKTQSDAKKTQEELNQTQEAAKKAQEDAKRAQDDVKQAQEAADQARQSVEQSGKDALEALLKVHKEAAEAFAKADQEMKGMATKTQKETLDAIAKAQRDAMDRIAADGQKAFGTAQKAIFTSLKATLKFVKKNGKNEVKIRWSKVKGAEGYVIQFASNAKFKKAGSMTVKNGLVGQKKIGKLKGNKKYYFRIRAYRHYNGEKIFTQYSGKKSLLIK